ncbi:hypothetical protein [Neorhizobium sp. DAR64860/K0K1]|uniref:hypothetical protein n=1 Tax=Neorhizobium sp. DAR64860/K0K1 TaxID=3421955 RepID=UPI003D2E742C
MPIIDDAATFERLGREQAIRVATALARILNKSQLVDFDLASPGEAERKLLFDLAFFTIIVFETGANEVDGEQRFIARPTFEAKGPDPVELANDLTLIIGHTQIHGLLEDPELEEALVRARS